MKFIFPFLILLLISLSIYSQKQIELKAIPANFKKAKFYVDNIKDERVFKDNIGELKTGILKKPIRIDFKGGLLNTTGTYFQNNFPKLSENQIKTEILIKKVEVKQGVIKSHENGIASVVLEFKYLDKTFEAKAEIYDEVEDAFSTHEERIRRAFYECAVQFNNSLTIEVENDSTGTQPGDVIEIVFNGNSETNEKKYVIKEKRVRPETRNIIAIGYQIGGYSLIGIDYELRVHNYIGINVGVGIFGYTGGLKFHPSKRKNSPFLCVSWKDGGWGTLNGFAIETGGRWIWAKKIDLGLLYQIGFMKINYIDPVYEMTVFGSAGAPPLIMSLGLGISW